MCRGVEASILAPLPPRGDVAFQLIFFGIADRDLEWVEACIDALTQKRYEVEQGGYFMSIA